ncbi:MAG: endonuclease/exonuclease/phosphatase family protein [Bacteroidota bacterium]|nr:endonuclease/exonuclease/phosphatase family protein [Bacteroidota bacterium]
MILLFWLTFSSYNPSPKETLKINSREGTKGFVKKNIHILSWNLGYAGLGKEMDFFYEGGNRVRPEREEFDDYFSGIKTTLVKMKDSVDFYFLQEVDKYSKRSYYTDEISGIAGVLNNYCYSFAKNYDCKFVPLPLNDPMGRVVSGIAVFSRYVPHQATRMDFGTSFGWPRQLFFLRRCFMVMRYPLDDGKELVLVNIHNSTYDKNGKLRQQEQRILRNFLLSEYKKGNYVIAGGDWNANPKGFDPRTFHNGDKGMRIDPPLPEDFMSGWGFAFDPSGPTNREVNAVYSSRKTRTTVIDFFIVSPNVHIVSSETLRYGFTFSDHQPVLLHAELK